jgi:hypothetical protein
MQRACRRPVVQVADITPGFHPEREGFMADYAKMRRDASSRKTSLEKELETARATVKDCEKELVVVQQILDALKGASMGKGGGKAPRGKPGKWRPGRPGRPPKWYVEQQKGKKAAGGGAKKRRGRKPGRRKASAAPAAAPEPSAAPTS